MSFGGNVQSFLIGAAICGIATCAVKDNNFADKLSSEKDKSYIAGKVDGTAIGRKQGDQLKYDEGYAKGVEVSTETARNEALEEGYNDGWSVGYAKGALDGAIDTTEDYGFLAFGLGVLLLIITLVYTLGSKMLKRPVNAVVSRWNVFWERRHLRNSLDKILAAFPALNEETKRLYDSEQDTLFALKELEGSMIQLSTDATEARLRRAKFEVDIDNNKLSNQHETELLDMSSKLQTIRNNIKDKKDRERIGKYMHQIDEILNKTDLPWEIKEKIISHKNKEDGQ